MTPVALWIARQLSIPRIRVTILVNKFREIDRPTTQIVANKERILLELRTVLLDQRIHFLLKLFGDVRIHRSGPTVEGPVAGRVDLIWIANLGYERLAGVKILSEVVEQPTLDIWISHSHQTDGPTIIQGSRVQGIINKPTDIRFPKRGLINPDKLQLHSIQFVFLTFVLIHTQKIRNTAISKSSRPIR